MASEWEMTFITQAFVSGIEPIWDGPQCLGLQYPVLGTDISECLPEVWGFVAPNPGGGTVA